MKCEIQPPLGTCVWDEERKKCDLDNMTNVCQPLIMNPLEEFDCKQLGCEWTDEVCCPASSASTKGYQVSFTLSIGVIVATVVTIFS